MLYFLWTIWVCVVVSSLIGLLADAGRLPLDVGLLVGVAIIISIVAPTWGFHDD